MQQNGKQTTPIGLDVGTSRIVTARPGGEGFIYSTQLNAFVDLPWSKLTAETLSKQGLPHALADSRILVYGTESARFADLLGVETRRSMSRGVLNSCDTFAMKDSRSRIASSTTTRPPEIYGPEKGTG